MIRERPYDSVDDFAAGPPYYKVHDDYLTIMILVGILFLLPMIAGIGKHRLEDVPTEYDAISVIRHWGYPVETHHVTTSDGYILTMFRITGGRNRAPGRRSRKPPVILQHGLASSCVDFIDNRPNHSLAFILADHGYDIWLSNSRGSSYSRGHTKLTDQMKEYWDFSWQQMSEFDLPAVVNFVQEITDSKCVHYIGHSQGTLMAFARLTYDEKLNEQAMLAVVGIYALGQTDWMLEHLTPFCEDDEEWLDFCESLTFFIAGPEKKDHLDQTMMPQYLAQHPDDTSIKNIVHFGQMVRSGKVAKFDYGYIKNLRRYGQLHPPTYDLGNTTLKRVYLFASQADAFADVIDFRNLVKNLKHYEQIWNFTDFSHLDFVISPLATEIIYYPILDKMGDF